MYLYQSILLIGSESFDDSYFVLNCQKIEDNFKKYYENNLLESSDIDFTKSIRVDWKNNQAKGNSVFWKREMAGLIIIISRNQIDKDLSQYLDTNFSNNENKMIISQYYIFWFD